MPCLKPSLRSLFFGICFLCIAAAPSTEGKSKGSLLERIVATVNGEVVLLSDVVEAEKQVQLKLGNQLKPKPVEDPQGFRKRVLDQLINDRLISQELEKRGLSATDLMLDQAVETVMQQNGISSVKALKRELRNEGLTLEEYRENLRRQMETSRLMEVLIRPRVAVTDQDVEAAYRRQVLSEPKVMKYGARMIFKAKPKASKRTMKKLQKQLATGIPFEKVAKRETEGPAKAEGGYIGLVSPSDLQPGLGRVLKKMKPGEISSLITTEAGYYFLQCTEKKEAPRKNLETAQEKIKQELTKVETERKFDLFVRELRDKAHLRITL